MVKSMTDKPYYIKHQCFLYANQAILTHYIPLPTDQIKKNKKIMISNATFKNAKQGVQN